MHRPNRLQLIGIPLLLLSVSLLNATRAGAEGWQWIDAQRVGAHLKEGGGFWLIDVRSQAAYDAEHIEGSVNIPATGLKSRKFPPRKTIVLIDDALGDRNAREAAERLAKNGHERVSVLEGGIARWKIDGYPLVEKKAVVRRTTATEVAWALENKVPFKLYDLRCAKAREKEPLGNSEGISGNTLEERLNLLGQLLSAAAKRKDLASKLANTTQIVLVFSASDDGERLTRTLLQNVNSDARYLVGGYEAMISERIRGRQTTGACPACPGKKENR